jgi:acetyl-CoA/propionyl-CoA carboxylase biotin carboxyl carrier protein
MGITTIAVYSQGEEQAPHVRAADEAYRLESNNPLAYLDIEAVMAVAAISRADAVHPGYGFLAENAGFATAVLAAGIAFVGPSPNAISSMGDKVEARRIATAAGIGPVPGTTEPVASIEAAIVEADQIGYPVAVKAVGGGGGRGFRVARTPEDLPEAFAGSSGEAARYFSNAEVYLERYLDHPRHIEVQVFADQHGQVVALGERDCSVQRRHQKLIEETPSVAVDESLRQRLNEASEQLARAVDYTGAGTIEYLLAPDGSFYFLEMNTRIQVEHTVTEMVTGVDLVREQIQVAMGEPLSFTTADLGPRGWSIECRVNAEDAGRDFAPGPGTITKYAEPVGFGVRVDAALGLGDSVLPAFDSMIAKVVTWGRDRDEARHRMIRALSDYCIEGVPTTIPFHLNVLRSETFAAGDLSTTFLTDHPGLIPPPASVSSGAMAETAVPVEMVIEVNGKRFETRIFGEPAVGSEPNGRSGKRSRKRATARLDRPSAAGNELHSPIQGTVIRVSAAVGEEVEAGQVICVVEAMKMENDLTAQRAGVIESLSVEVGHAVGIGAVIATIVDGPNQS